LKGLDHRDKDLDVFGHQYSCLDVFKFPLDLVTGRGYTICPLPAIACWRGKHSLRGSEYWGGLEGRNLYRGPQFTGFFYIYRKGLIGVWYCNLRSPVKATSLGHPRHTEARPQNKASNIYQPENWKMQVPSRKNKMLGSCLLANSRQPL
jgi:hypothetical protein